MHCYAEKMERKEERKKKCCWCMRFTFLGGIFIWHGRTPCMDGMSIGKIL